MKAMSTPIASLAASPHTASQPDECGAAISTMRGTSGKSPTIVQPPSRSTLRPNQRVKALPPRGALGGKVGTRVVTRRVPSRGRCGCA